MINNCDNRRRNYEIVHFFVGSIQVIMPVFSYSLQGNGAQNLGYIQMFFGFGVVMTALYLSIKGIKNTEKYLFSAITALGFIYIIFGIFNFIGLINIFPYFLIFFLISSSVIVISTCYQTILQKNVENEMAGRVFSVIGSIGNSTLPLASLVFGFLLNVFKQSQLLIFCGLTVVLISILLFNIYKVKTTVIESI